MPPGALPRTESRIKWRLKHRDAGLGNAVLHSTMHRELQRRFEGSFGWWRQAVGQGYEREPQLLARRIIEIGHDLG